MSTFFGLFCVCISISHIRSSEFFTVLRNVNRKSKMPKRINSGTHSQWGSGDPYAFLGTFFETFRITYVYIKEFKTT